ncbi:MAG: hypothetical protein QOI48_3065 [Solirubrobacteraceae bacterium]|nr:hypothetical protein [Solirubrobacteraceae bacterium]
MPDWVTISSLATAGGTLVLAGATFSAVRSANRSARIAEQALQEQRRPLLVNARLDDPLQKVMFANGHWLRAEGSEAVIEEEDGTLYLALALRNVGSGIAVLEGWHPWPELVVSDVGHPPPEHFRRQVRDIYIAAGDVGMWQGVLRDDTDDADDAIAGIAAAHAERRPFSIDLLYSDQVGGHHTISRFVATPAGDDQWLGYVGLHWNLDLAGRDNWGRR